MGGATVAVCLATHRPDPELLHRQLASLDAQTYADRVLVREDDAAGSGAYRAFERCLARVPADASYVAPCDQDDAWHPDKLAVLIEALETTGALLAYCDLRIVRADGVVLSETYWTDRDNDADDLADLLATNVVTGAASVLRRAVLDVALPFPREVDGSYHDHWLALCALALGDLAYVARPLVDYVQHDANLVGHAERHPRRAATPAGTPPAARPRRPPLAVRSRRDHERHVVRPQVMARTLLERAGDRMPPVKRRAAEQAARGDAGWADVARLLVLAAREQARPRRTLDARRRAARGALWRRLARS
jgi:glycosyl transferase family 2